jgi:hypothetical protein
MKPDVKVLFTSDCTADIVTRKGLLDDNVPFISKPVLPKYLLQKINEVLHTDLP